MYPVPTLPNTMAQSLGLTSLTCCQPREALYWLKLLWSQVHMKILYLLALGWGQGKQLGNPEVWSGAFAGDVLAPQTPLTSFSLPYTSCRLALIIARCRLPTVPI